ncbi:methylenetetrahydrofolate reduct [Cenococcum geophilum 1.58]|uniref:methylenetetrahydrofolate reduct n=1 Tax=Cenococcum geophilum 1.58 TaxID=794803 RepID=UPI00358DED42|nr:methylenetetrahydrofolate reduct [Cenococcum geophilum 1.58]
MHISQKLEESRKANKPTFSFEFFPPKTAQPIYSNSTGIDRMHDFGPAFIDITWGAGVRLSHLTCEMVKVAQNAYGLETCMHLTCTDMDKSKIDEGLKEAYKAGCTNILALRGDPPREKEKWETTAGGFRYAKDLVKYIREKYGNHFDIGVAGYPEGCEDQDDPDVLLDHLKEKVDAGATFIVNKVRAKGITVPIIPGIMPIHTYAAFMRRAQWTKCKIPQNWLKALEPIKNDDVEVREVGKGLVTDMCRRLIDAGILHLHFYTMNLAQATRMVLEELQLTPDLESPLEKPLPWRPSLGLNRRDENVRPIFWRNRNRSYVARTQDWDEFPNGRWGDARSPAFGELDAYGVGLKGTNEQNIKLWGRPESVKDIANVFEAEAIQEDLIDLNRRGFLTINSQPAVDGAKSSHPVYGWGPRNGYVYQKAYLEILISANT